MLRNHSHTRGTVYQNYHNNSYYDMSSLYNDTLHYCVHMHTASSLSKHQISTYTFLDILPFTPTLGLALVICLQVMNVDVNYFILLVVTLKMFHLVF